MLIVIPLNKKQIFIYYTLVILYLWWLFARDYRFLKKFTKNSKKKIN